MTTETARLSSTAERAAGAASDATDAAAASGAAGERPAASRANGSGSAPQSVSGTSAGPERSAEAPGEAPNDTLEAPASGDDPTSETASNFGLRRSDQLIVGLLVFAALGLAAVHWARLSGWGTHPIEIERLPERAYEFRLDINTATWVEWMQLPALGEALSKRIVADREQNGPYAGVDDLMRVRGIGPKTVERIRPWLREPRSGDSRPDRQGHTTRTSTSSASPRSVHAN